MLLRAEDDLAPIILPMTSSNGLPILLQAENSGDEEAAKRQRQSARGRQARLRSSHGDALSALNALCAFEAAGRTQDFCR